MPKKKKGDTKDPHEGRPTQQMTFGDFLVAKTKTVKQDVPSNEGSCATSTSAQVALSCASTEENQDAAQADQIEKKAIYFVCRTKKGGVPVKVESRSSGKKVTLIEHVLGDGKKLLQDLKNKFGTGGIHRDDYIELQGDCKTKVMKYFNDNKQLLKPYGTKI